MGWLADFADSIGFADLWHGFTGGDVSLKNIEAQEKANQMNYDLTLQSWARDDNAVQRRVNDLIKAGLSPTLAAGSAAGNSTPIPKNPVMASASTSPIAAIGPVAEIASIIANTEKTMADVQKTKAQTITELAEAKNADAYYKWRRQNMFATSDYNNSRAHNSWLNYELFQDTYDQRKNQIDWSTLLKKTQYEYLNKQYDIFNETGVDTRGNFGLLNPLKLLIQGFGTYEDRR